jgi:CMP-N-acetylneuraminic acid synthetase
MLNSKELYEAYFNKLRPLDISGDLVSSDDVILHAISYYRQNGINYNEICKFQPASPLRNEKHLQAAFGIFREKNADFVVSVCECEHSPLWSGVIGEDLSLDNFIPDEAKRACRQDLPKYYRLNGAIYMAKTNRFIENRSFIGKNSVAYIMNQNDSVDIDSELDFKLAEMLIE